MMREEAVENNFVVLLLMRRIALYRHMPFASYAEIRGTFRRYPPPLY